MVEYIQIFWILMSMQYPKDPSINLFDHTKYVISIDQKDSLYCTIDFTGPLAEQLIYERQLLEVELEVLKELERQDSIHKDDVWDDEVEYYPDFDPTIEEDSTSIDLHQSYDDSIDDYDLHLDLILNLDDIED